jgi:predicted glycoside hydrolase/deacetylase ChbG (UPF0249 family)
MSDMTTQKSIVINADDMGLHPDIDEAIIRLAEKRVVTSTSLMVLAYPDKEAINAVSKLGVDVGLHLDFTSEMANRRYQISRSIRSTIIDTYSRKMRIEESKNVVKDQLIQFIDITGSIPCFIDGHEHVHQMPVIRNALLDVLSDMNLKNLLFIRDTRTRQWRGMKAAVIASLGANTMARMTASSGYLGNRDFLGVYDLGKKIALQPLWEKWLRSITGHGALAMCHPAISTMQNRYPFRLREYEFLGSESFQNLLQENKVTTSNWRDWTSPVQDEQKCRSLTD